MHLRIDAAGKDIGLPKIVTFARLRGCSVADPCDAAITYSDMPLSMTRSVVTTRPLTTRSKSLIGTPDFALSER